MDVRSLPYCYLDGKTKDRLSPIKSFETNPEIKLFLISLKAGGMGLNLTAADIAILYDPRWNPMVENQAQIELTESWGKHIRFMVFCLITKGTVEEKIPGTCNKTNVNFFETVIEGGQKCAEKQ